MTTLLTSYAQNVEDVILWRALKHIDAGFYIDLGASDPVIDNVTCLFYRHGWSGVNVEPDSGAFGKLRAARPRDVNLNVLVGRAEEQQRFFIVGDRSGLSTTSEDFALEHSGLGWSLQTTVMPTVTLASICRLHVASDIHFLKIDVEGGEAAAIAGGDFSRFRPWIVVVEATMPNSQVPSHQTWEPRLLGSGYVFVYFDGLNRFYLAQERLDLQTAFSAPPNVFDMFERASERAWRERALELEAMLRKAT